MEFGILFLCYPMHHCKFHSIKSTLKAIFDLLEPSFIPQIFGTSIRIFILWIRRSSFSRLSKGKNQHDSEKCYQNRSLTFLCFLGLGCSCKRNIFDFNATIMRHSWNDVHFSSIDWLGPRFSGSIDKYEYFIFVKSKLELCNDFVHFRCLPLVTIPLLMRLISWRSHATVVHSIGICKTIYHCGRFGDQAKLVKKLGRRILLRKIRRRQFSKESAVL